MTISSEVRKAGPFSGNDVTTSFPFSFKVFTADDVKAVRADPALAESTLTKDVDYTVTLNADQNSSPGGFVELASPLSTGYTLVLTSQVQNLQPTDLTNQGGFYPSVINAALDRATIQIQQLAEQVMRAVKVEITSTTNPDQLVADLIAASAAAEAAAQAAQEAKDAAEAAAASVEDAAILRDDLASVDPDKGAELVGFKQLGTGAVNRDVMEKLRESFSVKDFGAVGDGVANDAPAIQAAIDAAVAAGGRKVLIPAGTYNLNSGIVWTGGGVSLIGDGERTTTLRCTFASGDILCIGDGTANPNDCLISDLSITSTVAKTSGAAVRFRNGHNLKAANLRLNSNLYYGFQFDGGAGQFLYYLENFEINSGVNGIICGAVGFPQDIWVSDGIIAGCSGAAILLKNVSGWYFEHLDLLGCDSGITTFPDSGQIVKAGFLTAVIADTCNSSGFKFFTNGGYVSDVIMNGSWGASCGVTDNGHGMHVDGDVRSLQVGDCRFVNNKGSGILLQQGLDVTISNTQCLSNSQMGSGIQHGFEVSAGVSQWSVNGGVFGQGGEFSTNNQGWGILVNTGASNNYSIIGANLLGNVTGALSDGGSGTSKHIYGNQGYRTSNQGVVTITAGTSSVTFNHGLAATPNKEDIMVTPVSDPGALYWVSSTTATQATISLPGNSAVNRFFGWSARIKGA